jgi:glycosyltransferase involved in cell wall biosynthesis
MKPKVSVLMSVYNGEKFIDRAISSILNQTFDEFEFIIVDDGSTDNTPNILHRYARDDKRIHIITQRNKGLTISLNIGAKVARGKYIARQDADDESSPDRLTKQYKYMEQCKDVVLLGTNEYEISYGIKRVGKYIDDQRIEKYIHLHNPFSHSSVMFRDDIFKIVGGYDESYKAAQDYECWLRMSQKGKVIMLPNILINRFTNKNSITRKKRYWQCKYGTIARFKYRNNMSVIKIVLASIYQWLTSYIPESVIYLKRKLDI